MCVTRQICKFFNLGKQGENPHKLMPHAKLAFNYVSASYYDIQIIQKLIFNIGHCNPNVPLITECVVPKTNHWQHHSQPWLNCTHFVLFLSTQILAIGGWLNSFFELRSSCFSLLEILTAPLACLERGSLNLLVISMLNFISSFSCALCLCL